MSLDLPILILQRLREIFNQVFNVFQADGEANDALIDAGFFAAAGRHRSVRHRHRMADQRFHAAERFRERKKF